MSDKSERFHGTYFDADVVLRLARLLEILSWVVVVIYALDLLIGFGTFALQYVRGFLGGFGFTDVAQQIVFILERPVHGIVYFTVLQVLAKGMLIFLDVEANTRRLGRG